MALRLGVKLEGQVFFWKVRVNSSICQQRYVDTEEISAENTFREILRSAEKCNTLHRYFLSELKKLNSTGGKAR